METQGGVKDKPIVIERVYATPVSAVWKALTDKESMKQWYFEVDDFKAIPGFEFSFQGQGKEGENYLHLCKVLEVVEEKSLSYSWRYDGYEGNSVVRFDLFPEGDKTKLVLTHSGLETFPRETDAFAKANFVEGWTYITGTALAAFVEK